MRNCTIQAVAVQVTCPGCRDVIPCPSTGALMWDTNDIHADQTVTCMCGIQSKVKVPKFVQVV